jgi:hypothetical protein
MIHIDTQSRRWITTEAFTAKGSIVKASVLEGHQEAFKQALAQVERVDYPVTQLVSVKHGGYCQYSRFQIKQHRYAGGDGVDSGFIEVLEISDPPDGRHGILVYDYCSGGASWFYEFETLDQATSAFERAWGIRNSQGEIVAQPGMTRSVRCGKLIPWFYAIDREQLYGDFTLPSGVSDHPVYRLGARFAVKVRSNLDFKDYDVFKTCLGCRVVPYVPDRLTAAYSSNYNDKNKLMCIIYWDDATESHVIDGQEGPRPVDGQEVWIDKAMQEFRKFLQGRTKEFEVNLLNGDKLTAKLKPGREHDEAGRYHARVTFDNGKQVEGPFDFTPTAELPSTRAFIIDRFSKSVITQIEVKLQDKQKKNKKWGGVFYGGK